MDRKYIIRQIFIIALAFVVAHFCTLKYYANDYKVSLRQEQHRLTVTNFDVVPENSNIVLSMFKPSFYVDVTIDGTLNSETADVEYVQKSERVEQIDGKDVVIIEFEPVICTTLNLFRVLNDEFPVSFRHKVYGYNDKPELTYIFRCGDFEKVVYAEWH